MPARPTIAALLAGLLLVPAFLATAADRPAIEPEAEAALRAALGRIAAARSFSFSADVESERPLPTAERIRFSGTLKVAVRRPNGLRVDFEGEPRSTRSWFDGRTFTHFDPGGNAYATCEARGSLEQLFPVMREKLGFTPPLSRLIHENVVAETLAATRTGFTVGPAVVRGVTTRQLAFRGETADWQVWVSGDRDPVIEKIVITSGGGDGGAQYVATFSGWDFSPNLADADFAFAPPPGSVPCEFEAPGKPEGGR